jgi:hypothetical protein
MAKSKAAGFRDRIKELRRVPASSLLPNPKNWRTHPQAQQDALRGILSEIGIADAVLAREMPDGSLMLIDGHLRAETVADAMVPVLVLDVTEAEADLMLVTFDPLSSLATSDSGKLDELLRSVKTEDQAIQQMLNDTAVQSGLYTGEWQGKGVEDVGAIGEYDPDSETVSIRLNNVPVSHRDSVVQAVDAAVASLGLKCEVF